MSHYHQLITRATGETDPKRLAAIEQAMRLASGGILSEMIARRAPAEEAEVRRWAFLSCYAARNDAEEAEALRLQAKYGEETGWPLVPREPSFKGVKQK